MTRSLLRLSLAAALLLAAGAARAGTATSNISVSAQVLKTCKIATTNVAFSPYDPTSSANPTTTATVTVTFTKGTSWSVDLDGGQNTGKDTSGAFTSNRAMTDGTNFLAYDLYTDAGYTTQWLVSGATGVSSGKAASTATPIYAKILDADPYAGTYADTVVATVNF